MKILLDTCTFLWIISDDPRLSPRALELFVDPSNDVYLSVASTWEITIKYGLKRLPLPEPPEYFMPDQRNRHGISSLPLEEDATFCLAKLPDFHKDPFDRILICQAIVSGMVILTPDEFISQYPVKSIW